MDNPEKRGVPWQNRQGSGPADAFWKTLKFILFKPAKFFADLKAEKSYLAPLSFAFFACLITAFGITALNAVYKRSIFSPKFLLALVSSFISTFVIVPIGLFIMSGIMHPFVLLLKGKGKFKGTFDILAYSSAANVVSIIPLIGSIAAWIWGIIIMVTGYKQVHQFSTPKAIVAYGFPMLFIIAVLSAAIAVPNFLNARLALNENAAEATVKSMAAAAEDYAAQKNGEYPAGESDFKFAPPVYMDKINNNQAILGYVYSLDMGPAGYKISATPDKCGITGNKIFTIETKSQIAEKSCLKAR